MKTQVLRSMILAGLLTVGLALTGWAAEEEIQTDLGVGGCPRIAIFSQIEANSKKLPEAYS